MGDGRMDTPWYRHNGKAVSNRREEITDLCNSVGGFRHVLTEESLGHTS